MDSTNENLVSVFDIENQTQEALIRTALDESGIHYMIINPDGMEFMQTETFNHHAKVKVLEHEVEKAKTIIEQAVGDDA